MHAKLGSVYRIGTGSLVAQLRCGIMPSRGTSFEQRFFTPQYAIVYLPDGQGWYTDSSGREYEIAPGSFIQRFPSRVHSVRLEAQTLRCWVAVPCQVFELFALTGVTTHARPVIYVGRDQKLVDEIASIRDELASRDEHELMETLARMQMFIMKLHRRGRKHMVDDDQAQPIQRAVQLLSEDLGVRLKLPDVARKVDMSYSAFRKRFVDHVGTSPGDFRIRRRMERAMAMLTGEDLLIKEVAERLGYPDEYAFSAQFKKMTGSSPKEFRARNS